MAEWESFFVAQVGASAALAGLVFVSVSINLTRILKHKTLPNRAAEALIILLQIVFAASLALVPTQVTAALGLELFVLGCSVWLTMTTVDYRNIKATDPKYRRTARFNAGMTQLATLPYIVAGGLLLTDARAGLYFLVGGMLLSYAKAMLDAWILLVEINR